MDRDLGSTLSGAGVGLAMLASIHWESIPHGEVIRLIIALALIPAGYFMYRGK